jgi:hypothetical protein
LLGIWLTELYCRHERLVVLYARMYRSSSTSKSAASRSSLVGSKASGPHA